MSDDANGRDRLGEALARSRDEFGVDPLTDPLRATAIVADLVGHPTRTDIDDIALLRSTLVELADQAGADAETIDRAAVLAALTAGGAEPASASRLLDLSLDTLGLTTVRPTFWTTPRAVAAFVAVVVVVVVGIVLLRPSPDDDEAGEGDTDATTIAPATTAMTDTADTTVTTDAGGTTTTGVSTTTTITTTTTTAPEQPRNGLVATFEPVREGPFLVTRGWRVTPNQTEFVGIVLIASADGGTAVGTHTELPPPGAVPTDEGLVWDPEAAGEIGTIGRFTNLTVAGTDVIPIEYRAPLDFDQVLTSVDVLAWFEEWRPLADETRPLGESDALLQPIVEIEEV